MDQGKERLVATPETIKRPEMVDVSPREAPLPKEVKSWMEKLEEDPTLAAQRITDDSTGQTVMNPVTAADPTVVVLPVNRTTFTNGFKQTVSDASRWLSVFLFRLIKIKNGKVKFKEE